MTWISLVCLLALSSSALARSMYGGYGSSYPGSYGAPKAFDAPQPSPYMQLEAPKTYGSYEAPKADYPAPAPYAAPSNDAPRAYAAPQYPVLSAADLLCRGQARETVIPIEDGRKFVVCLDESKGAEQSCPKGLVYHSGLQRCERKNYAYEDNCASSPCQYGGQCVSTESSYECRCTPGYGGKNCELDTSACDQYPCGNAPYTTCQSFRHGAALKHICILSEDYSYGHSHSQPYGNPCNGYDGPRALQHTNKGFAICDGERVHFESCPGNTVWDDNAKACTWEDTARYGTPSYNAAPAAEQPKAYNSYAAPQPMAEQPKAYNSYAAPQPMAEQPKAYNSYAPQPAAEQPKAYAAPVAEQPRAYNPYAAPQPAAEQPKHYGAYAAPQPMAEQPKAYNSYAPQPAAEQPRAYNSYAAPQPMAEQPKHYGAYAAPQPAAEQPKAYNSYAPQPAAEQPKAYNSYAPQPAAEQPKAYNSYAAPQQMAEQPKPYGGYPAAEQPKHYGGYPAPQPKAYNAPSEYGPQISLEPAQEQSYSRPSAY